MVTEFHKKKLKKLLQATTKKEKENIPTGLVFSY